MYRINGLRIFGTCCLLLLVSLTGCATRESVAPDAHPEKYREVYLMKPKDDSRNVAAHVAERLRRASFEVHEVPYDPSTKAGQLEGIKRARDLAAANDHGQPVALCGFSYLSLYRQSDDTFMVTYDFERIEIKFYDLKTEDLIFKTAKYNYDYPVPEDLELNRRFAKISDAFFPGQPNPFLTR